MTFTPGGVRPHGFCIRTSELSGGVEQFNWMCTLVRNKKLGNQKTKEKKQETENQENLIKTRKLDQNQELQIYEKVSRA